MIGLKRVLTGVALLGAMVMSAPGTAYAAGEWHLAAGPALWPESRVLDMAATGPDNVWVGGYEGYVCVTTAIMEPCKMISRGKPVVRRWDGSKWSDHPLNAGADTRRIDTVEAYGSEVWASASKNLVYVQETYLGRFDGRRFQPVATPEGVHPRDLSVNAAGIWLSQRNNIYRWNGSGWTETPSQVALKGVSPVKAGRAGEAWMQAYADDGFILLRWDGDQWSKAADIPNPSSLYFAAERPDIEVTVSGAVWIVRDDSWTPNPDSRIFRYQNGTMTDLTPGPGNYERLTLDQHDSVWAVGDELLRFDGAEWRKEPKPLLALADVIAVPRSEDLWGYVPQSSLLYRTSRTG